MSALFRHHFFVTIQPRLLFPIIIVLAAAPQLLLGGNKLVLVFAVRVQVQLVVQKIPDQTDSEAQYSEVFHRNSFTSSAETMSRSVSGLKKKVMTTALTAVF